MELSSMDNILIEIYNIKNIEKIKIISFSLKQENNIDIIPSLLVTYDGGKNLILNERDKYFKTFVKKVTEVFNDEKERNLSVNIDPFKLNTKIDISDHDRSILENGILTTINKQYSFYENKQEYQETLFYVEDEIKKVFSIFKYHLEDFFSSNNLKLEKIHNVFMNKFTAICKIDGEYKDIYFDYQKINDNTFLFNVKHLFNNLSIFNIKIGFKNDSIIVTLSTQINNTSIYGEYNYIQEEKGLKYIKNINKDGICIYYEDRYLESVKNDEVIDFDTSFTNIKWYQLPWKSKYGYENITKEISGNEKIIERHYIYNDISQNYFYSKEKYTKIYQQLNKFNEVVLDHMDKDVFGLQKEDNMYITETSFLDCNFKNGFYDLKLNGNYFYHLIEKDGKEYKVVKELNGLDDKVDMLRLFKGEMK